MKILILAPYPARKSPNQRFRFEQYLELLNEAGIEYDYQPFWSDRVWSIFYQKGHWLTKTTGLFRGLWNRLLLLFQLPEYDYIFVHREGLPVGPPAYEYIISRWWRKKIVYDFDDAIWINNYSIANKRIARFLKFHRKVPAICRYSYRISTGNEFLADFARKLNQDVVVIPTTIDTKNLHNRLKQTRQSEKLNIGWTGTHSTLFQLAEIENQLGLLQKEIDFDLHVICNADPQFSSVKYQYIPWQAASEIDDLLKFDIGIMPLKNTDWERGKCGFKALQYMSLGIPVVASDVGVNNEIIAHEQNGLLIPPNQPELWISALKTLLLDPQLRQKLGVAGRHTVETRYSVESNKEKYIQLFS